MRIFIVIAFLGMVACGQPPKADVQSNLGVFKDVELTEFENLISKTNAQLIDVRTPEEFAEGSIPGAVNIDFRNDAFEANIGKLNKANPVLLFCRSGGRSSSAMGQLQEMQFKEVYNLLDGYLGYNEAKKKGVE
jgi:rhodanese-related sulfurtransferase